MAKDSDERTTPDWLFRVLDDYLHFNLDAAATRENAKCARFWTKEDDGLKQPWAPGPVFCNPPYSRGELAKWVHKAAFESRERGIVVAMVLPGDFGTKWFQEVWRSARYIWFVRGRVKFNGMASAAKFPTAVAVFGLNIAAPIWLLRGDGGRVVEL